MDKKFENELKNSIEISAILMNVPAFVELMSKSKCYNIENGIEYINYLGSLKTVIIKNESIDKLENEIKIENGNIVIKLVDTAFTTISVYNSIEGFWLSDSYINLCVNPNSDNLKRFLKNLDIYINR